MGLLILRSAGSAGGGGEEPGEWVGKTAHYVRQGASGTGSGNDWTNAYTTLPAALTRDHVYYIADGSYVGYTFDDAASGALKIYVVKATASDHGTDTGWSDAFGDGQALFTSQLSFTTNNWHVDGAVGGGPGSWLSGHGIQVHETGSGDAIIDLHSSANVTISHMELRGMDSDGSDGGSIGNDGIRLVDGPSDFTGRYLRFVGIGRCPIFAPDSDGTILFEYSAVESFWADTDPHGEVMSMGDGSSPTTFIWRWGLVLDIRSTGGFMYDNSANHADSMYIYGSVFYFRTGSSAWEAANGIIGGWSGGNGEDFFNAHVYNNTFINTESGGEALSTFPLRNGSNEARNNLFYSVGDLGGSPVWQTITHNHFVDGSTIGTNTSTDTGDPFVDYVNFDFRLTSNTTAGTDLGSPYNVDMYGNARTTWTRGAIEFGS